MAIISCEHEDYIVVYDTGIGRKATCPVCAMEKELNEAKQEIETLESLIVE